MFWNSEGSRWIGIEGRRFKARGAAAHRAGGEGRRRKKEGQPMGRGERGGVETDTACRRHRLGHLSSASFHPPPLIRPRSSASASSALAISQQLQHCWIPLLFDESQVEGSFDMHKFELTHKYINILDIWKNFKLCCNMEEHSVSQNRNSTVIYEGGCRNGVYLKLKLDSMRRGFQGVFFLLE